MITKGRAPNSRGCRAGRGADRRASPRNPSSAGVTQRTSSNSPAPTPNCGRRRQDGRPLPAARRTHAIVQRLARQAAVRVLRLRRRAGTPSVSSSSRKGSTFPRRSNSSPVAPGLSFSARTRTSVSRPVVRASSYRSNRAAAFYAAHLRSPRSAEAAQAAEYLASRGINGRNSRPVRGRRRAPREDRALARSASGGLLGERR